MGRRRVAVLTARSTATFTTIATIPTLRSVITEGHDGKSEPIVAPVSVSAATVASPATMPASAPSRVASGRLGKLAISAGKSCVTTL